MNALFLSPAFPPNAYRFCTALRARGATVLAIGDVPANQLSSELANSLTTYVFEPDMGRYDALHGAVNALVAQYGGIDQLDSNAEHWLSFESRLRDDFGVPGVGAAKLNALRSKLAMAETFAAADIPHPPGISAGSSAAVRDFARTHGFPLVFKPDVGSGAQDTFPVTNEADLEAALATPRPGHIVQRFITGDIVTFDGLVDRDGRIVYFTSHAYDAGIMQVRRGGLDGYYYSLRSVPAGLETLGRRAVAAFGVRARFFHLEVFSTADGYVALEMNIRPPGGFTTDMMNAAGPLDVYDLWAAIVTGADVGSWTYDLTHHTAHAGRRTDRHYKYSEADLVNALGDTLVSIETVPDAFSVTMGNTAYLLRSENLSALLAAIALVQGPASSTFAP